MTTWQQLKRACFPGAQMQGFIWRWQLPQSTSCCMSGFLRLVSILLCMHFVLAQASESQKWPGIHPLLSSAGLGQRRLDCFVDQDGFWKCSIPRVLQNHAAVSESRFGGAHATSHGACHAIWSCQGFSCCCLSDLHSAMLMSIYKPLLS